MTASKDRLTWRVPVVAAVPPGDVTSERGEHVEEAPCDDHVVVDSGERRHSEHPPADPYCNTP